MYLVLEKVNSLDGFNLNSTLNRQETQNYILRHTENISNEDSNLLQFFDKINYSILEQTSHYSK